MRELSSPRVDQSARCPVHELAYPRVVQLPLASFVIVPGVNLPRYRWLIALHSVHFFAAGTMWSVLYRADVSFGEGTVKV